MTVRPSDRRPTSMVFQSYVLFPHMNVTRNVGSGLWLKKLSRAEISEKVGRMLSLAGLYGLDRRMPHELSGGQVVGRDGALARVDLGFTQVSVPTRDLPVDVGSTVSVSVRSELLRIGPHGEPHSAETQSVPAAFVKTVYLGLTSSSLARMPDGNDVVVRDLSHAPGNEPGHDQPITVRWRTDHARLHLS